MDTAEIKKEVLKSVLEKLYELRPTSFRHLDRRTGRYWHPVLGYSAQLSVVLARLTQRIKDSRLSTCEGQRLIEYIKGEVGTLPDLTETYAEGYVVVGRDPLKDMPGSTLAAGTRIELSETTVAGVKFGPATYETLVGAQLESGSPAHVTIPIRSIGTGTSANIPIVEGLALSAAVQTVIENVNVVSIEAGGGSKTPSDTYLRRFARIANRGAIGPTNDASKYAALSCPGVRRYRVFDDPNAGTQRIQVADESWGSSSRFAKITQQHIYDSGLVGFGSRVSCEPIKNTIVAVSANVSLRDGGYLSDTVDVELAISKAALEYFDDREDWDSFDNQLLTSVISRSHPKILACTSVLVTNALTGAPIVDSVRGGTHLMMANGSRPDSNTVPAIEVTFSGPV